MQAPRTRTHSTGMSLSDATAMLNESAARSEPHSWEEMVIAAAQYSRSPERSKPVPLMSLDVAHKRASPHAFSLPSQPNFSPNSGCRQCSPHSHKPPSPANIMSPLVGAPIVIKPLTRKMTPPRFVSVLVPPPPPMGLPPMPAAMSASPGGQVMMMNTPPAVRFLPPPPPSLMACLNGKMLLSQQQKRKDLHEKAIKYEFAIGNHRVEQMNKSKAAVMQTTENVHVAILNAHPSAPMNHQVVRITGDKQGVNKALHAIRRMFPAKQYPDINLLPLPPAAMPPSNANNGSPTCLSVSPSAMVPTGHQWVPMPENVALDCTLAAVHSIEQFFLVQHTHPSFPQLELLEKGMHDAYEGKEVPLLPLPLQVGSLCAIYVNDQWCRAVLMKESLARLVDHGGYVKVGHEQLRQIRSDFTTLPFQATECTLSNMQLSTNIQLMSVITDAFCTLASSHALRVTCISQVADGSATVNLEVMLNGHWVDIADQLKEAIQTESEGSTNNGLGLAAEPLLEQDEYEDQEESAADFGGFEME